MHHSVIHFVVNLQAKNGYCRKIWEEIVQELTEKDIEFLAFYTKYVGHAEKIAKMIGENSAGKKTILVAVGGDGTLHEVVNGAIHYQNLVVANIPAGSGNDFSRGFRIPRKPRSALQLVLDEEYYDETLIDVGSVKLNEQECYFINNMGAGFDALITTEANHSKIKKLLNRFSLGTLVYVFILLKELFGYRTSTVELTIDDEKQVFPSVWFVTISNQPFYGGGMKIAPNASSIDGEFDVTVVYRVSRLKILFLFVSVFWGGHTKIKGVKCFRGRSIQIQSQDSIPVHADGEYIGTAPLQIKVLPRVLSILQFNKSSQLK